MSLKDILFEMQMQGYQPIIAHPERYIYLENNKDFYEELKDIGCLFQLNLLSLSGHYGKSVNELGQYLIKKGFYNLVGTDLHHKRHLDALHNGDLSNLLKKLLDSGKLINDKL
jgi:tyrosine-protein phosphatase YwqE